MTRRILRTALFLAAIYASSGCAIGTTPIKIDRTALDGSGAAARQGDIVVKRFTDVRDAEQTAYVGAKRNGYGMVLGHLGVPEGTTLEDILTEYFAEALREAGYRTVIGSDTPQPEGFSPVATIEGDIEKFWLDMYMATWHEVGVRARLRNSSDVVVWEGYFEGQETNVLWLGLSAEFESVIRSALDQALAQAVEEFSSDAFHEQLQPAPASDDAAPPAS